MKQNNQTSGGRLRASSVSVLLALACAFGCSKQEAPSENASAAPALHVELAQLTMTQMRDEIIATGSIAAREEVLLGVELSGVRVQEVLVDVGQSVRRGQVLLRLDSRTLALEEAQANAGVKQAKANLAVAEADARRGEALRQRGLVSARDVDQITAAKLSAEAALAVASANLQGAQLRLSFASLKAPSDGVISARSVQPGVVVQASSELLRLIKNGALEWRAELGEADFVRARIDSQARIAHAPKPILGRVRALDAGVQLSTRTALVYVALPADAALKAGSFAQGAIVLGARSVPALPASAVVLRDGYPFAFVLEEGIARQRRLELGVSQNGMIEVRSGLKEQDQVVKSGGGFLADGDRVSVQATKAAAVAP